MRARKNGKWAEDMTPVCKKCRKVAPIREDMSNENWIAYETSKPCECGGEFVFRFMLEVEA